MLLAVVVLAVGPLGLASCGGKTSSDAASGAAARDTAASDPERAGRALAEEVIASLGGRDAWKDPSWDLGFDFVVERNGEEVTRASHLWHRATNACTVSSKTKEGSVWRVDFQDIFARRGTATVDGHPVADSALADLLERGYGRFINDSYWLLMPMKLLDSGVHRRREPDTVIDGRAHKVLAVWFDKVGLTPGDHYWLYVDSATGRPTRWRFLLESGRPGVYLWERYQQVGPLTLSTLKRAPDGTSVIRFENIRAGRPRQ